MGGIHGMFLAQYEVLRERGHSPSEAFNETVEEATQSLYPLIGGYGMDWMYAACSTTARRGAIDWSSRFKDNLKPLFNELYDSVRDGTETQRSLDYNSQKDYREKYEKEMEEIRSLEIWRAGKAVRYVITFISYHLMNIIANISSFLQLPPSREPEINNILIP
jgi:ketol-acid reductoisomerase